jgi:hypothetical protein
MFIRQVKKQNAKNGKTFFQYQLVQASRIDGKVKQQSILYLGSEPLLSDDANRKMLLKTLQAKIFGQSLLFAEDYPLYIHEISEQYYGGFLASIISDLISGIDLVESIKRATSIL